MGHFASYYKSKLSVVPFVPTDIAGCQLWLDAGHGITLNGNYVSQWADQSGNNNHAVQSIVSCQPLYDSSEPLLNNKPVLKFDGNGDSFTFSEITTVRTYFVVVKHNTGTDSLSLILGNTSTYDYFGGYDGELFSNVYTSSFVLNALGKINGIQQYQSVMHKPTYYSIITIKTTGNTSINTVALDRTNSGNTWNGDMAEIIVYDSDLSAINMALVENYLSAKYAITIYSMLNTVPKMTGINTPSGTVIYSDFYPSLDPFKIFDKNPETGHIWASNGTLPSFVGYIYGSGRIVKCYSIVAIDMSPDQAPKSWLFQGSNDGLNWDDLDSQVNQTSWIYLSKRFYHISNVNSYTHYRVYITETNGSIYTRVAELEMYE